MAYDQKPTELPEFATTQRDEDIPGVPTPVSNLVPPSQAEKDFGDPHDQIPPRNISNWLRNLYYQWIKVLDQWTQENRSRNDAQDITIGELLATVNEIKDNRINTIRTLTGTTPATGGSVSIALPTDYYDKAAVLGAQVAFQNEWDFDGIGLGDFVVDTGVSYQVRGESITLYYVDDPRYHNRTYVVNIIKAID